MVQDPGCMADEEVLWFRGDQNPAVPDVEWHCQDGRKCPWNISSDDYGPFFVEISQDFSTKNSRSNASFGSNRTTFPIPEREKQTQFIIVFALINGRTRVGLATSTPAHIEDRELLQ
jgi:hypothetical protein